MPSSLVTLDALPTAAEFYAQFWNKQPFLVRGAIDEVLMDGLITPDELAGLSMEETARARMVSQGDWTCRFGPFAEKDFKTTGSSPWTLLVQDVDQFHPDTAALLRSFNFAPRWLMDDIMVSFSTEGGGIGGHVDSYHVFLVQGQGTRRWTIGRNPTRDKEYIDGLDLKILKDPVDGDSIEVRSGDVLYVPPHFAHEGTTLDDALTFSVGFLGPKLSELYDAYGQYLAEHEALDNRYTGAGLGDDTAGFTLSANAVDTLRGQIGDALNTPEFTEWLASFFTTSSNEETEPTGEREEPLDTGAFAETLDAGVGLVKPIYVKFALIPSSGDTYRLGFNRQTLVIDQDALPIILSLMTEEAIATNNTPALHEHADLLRILYNLQALEFADPAT